MVRVLAAIYRKQATERCVRTLAFCFSSSY
jgi:hypothetical protein